MQELLEKLKETPLSVSFKLASSIGLDVYKSFAAATTGGKTSSSFNLPKVENVFLQIKVDLVKFVQKVKRFKNVFYKFFHN